MIELIKEIKACVKANLFRCALGMALTLPDICGKVAYPAIGSVGERYEKWCREYLFNQGYVPAHDVDYSKTPDEWEPVRVIEPEMCYKLRCVFLHSGNFELNQRENDSFPIFKLHISSTRENGAYTDRNMRDNNNIIQEVSLDVRKLVKVLCNAAEEYYTKCEEKEKFANHETLIIDAEKESNSYAKEKCKDVQLQESEKEERWQELSKLAKNTFDRICNGELKVVLDESDNNKALSLAIDELIVAGALILPASEGLFE